MSCEEGVGKREADIVKVGATKNVAWRFHNDNIRCNAVLPGGKLLPSFYLHRSLISTGVATNIQHSVDMDCFDPAGFGAFLYVSTLFICIACQRRS